MDPNNTDQLRPDYGIDAPGLLRGMATGGVVAVAVGAGLVACPWRGRPVVVGVTVLALASAVYFFSMAAYMWYGSRVAKVRDRERLLDLVPWSGGETVLDVGCGRGLMLVGAAKRLTTGRAVGIDIWQAEDQSANDAGGAVANARLEGVGDRVTVETADMRRLPFPDESFDVVVSHWAVHNLYEADERTTALGEIARVLRPGGYVVLADIAHRGEYVGRLASLRLEAVRVVVSPTADAIRTAMTFGSFRPAAVVARKSTARAPAAT